MQCTMQVSAILFEESVGDEASQCVLYVFHISRMVTGTTEEAPINQMHGICFNHLLRQPNSWIQSMNKA